MDVDPHFLKSFSQSLQSNGWRTRRRETRLTLPTKPTAISCQECSLQRCLMSWQMSAFEKMSKGIIRKSGNLGIWFLWYPKTNKKPSPEFGHKLELLTPFFFCPWGPIYGSGCLSLSKRPFWFWLKKIKSQCQLLMSIGQSKAMRQCKWRHRMTKLVTNASTNVSGAICRPNLQPIQVALPGGQNWK